MQLGKRDSQDGESKDQEKMRESGQVRSMQMEESY